MVATPSVDEQVFETTQGGYRRVGDARGRSATLGGHVELVADRPPHVAGLLPGLQRLLDGAAVEPAEDVVAGDGSGPHGAELVGHELPEVGHAHGPEGSQRAGSVDRVTPLAAAPLDVSGSPIVTQLLALAAMVAALVVLLRAWFQNRRR